MKHPFMAKEDQAMRCVNCGNDVNGGPVCPYCHCHPIIYGSEPYQGLRYANEPGPYGPEMSLGVLGAILLPVFPPVGITLWDIAGLSLARKWWKNRSQE
jgi:hypothetical protein